MPRRDMMVETPIRILFVDDETDFRYSARLVLRGAGYDVFDAGNGREALRKILEAEEENLPFDLLITDIRMPGMSGTELMAAMREAKVSVPTVAITGFKETSLVAEMTELGCLGCIEKPFEPQALLSRIQRFLGQCGDEVTA